MNKRYEKPELNFVTLCNKESIADPCFPANYDDQNRSYYDTLGVGFVSFYQGTVKCGSTESLENLVVYYYVGKDPDGNLIGEKRLYPGDELYEDLKTQLLKENEHGSNFAPFGKSDLFHDNPGGMS